MFPATFRVARAYRESFYAFVEARLMKSKKPPGYSFLSCLRARNARMYVCAFAFGTGLIKVYDNFCAASYVFGTRKDVR